VPKPNTPPGLSKEFVVTHPTDPTSPRTVTQQQWKDEKLGQAGWVKEEVPEEPEVPEVPEEPEVNPL